MSESFDATEITKSDRRTSKATLHEENNIEDAVVLLSGKLGLSFHSMIHRY